MGGTIGYIQKGIPALIGLVLLAIPQTVAAEEAKPQETSGLRVDAKDLLALAAQIPAMAGYALRIRQITLEPGAVVAHHSHAERPIAVYVISGEFTEVPDEGPAITRGPGSQWVEGAEMRHWGANRGEVPTVLVAVDIVPQE
jgi:quercetin dioxygenase-like cupin family protein